MSGAAVTEWEQKDDEDRTTNRIPPPDGMG